MTKIDGKMLEALAAYSGPVTRCPPGKARGADLPKRKDRGQRWLHAHGDYVPSREKKAERRKKRMARAERDRIAKRNAFVRKRNGLGGPGKDDVERRRDGGVSLAASLKEESAK